MQRRLKSRPSGFTLIELMIVIAIIAILASILVPNFIRARGQGMFSACQSNLKNVGTALEMYSTDAAGRYPTALTTLSPNYLKTIPTCPSSGTATYTGGYTSASLPDAFTVVCTGTNHRAVDAPANYPQYTSQAGMIPK